MTRRRSRNPLILLAVPGLLLAACGTERAGDTDGAPAGAPSTAKDTRRTGETDRDTVYQGTFTVLEDGSHGPQLCDAVMESYPPQCSGPDVSGLDWAELPDGSYESADGTTWGEFTVTGTWDGQGLTLTETPEAPPVPLPGPEEPAPVPCEEPEGGWVPVDPEKSTEQHRIEAMARAEALEGFAGAWIRPLGPGEEETIGIPEGRDASSEVLVLRFSGDPAAHEPAIREEWGGPLCLDGAERTYAELTEANTRLGEEFPEITSWGVDVPGNTVSAMTYVVTEALRADLEAEFGPGTVTVTGSLMPLED